MLGMGKILGARNNSLESAVFKQGKFPWLKKGDTWSVDSNMRDVFIMASGNQTYAESKLEHNQWMSPDYGGSIGPEFGIANFGGSFKQDNVMLLKSCIGNRALGYDLLPPGSARKPYTDASGTKWTMGGYGDTCGKWLANETCAATPPKFGAWYAGKQWDGDTGNAAYILNNLTKDKNSPFFPRLGGSATKYEVAGFFWWQ
jgi:alpha-galactosidase